MFLYPFFLFFLSPLHAFTNSVDMSFRKITVIVPWFWKHQRRFRRNCRLNTPIFLPLDRLFSTNHYRPLLSPTLVPSRSTCQVSKIEVSTASFRMRPYTYRPLSSSFLIHIERSAQPWRGLRGNWISTIAPVMEIYWSDARQGLRTYFDDVEVVSKPEEMQHVGSNDFASFWHGFRKTFITN